uniref:Reverse transcriptase Ty1/copia-type domain-containing protein n=1 Tax=Tanacetum cinerariifolium TaxID=118510 RepID=A0A6L2NFV7_TANCI|nr:hypothetical protein [Tanacetum cinerariifolium]
MESVKKSKVNPVKVKDGAEAEELLNGSTRTHLIDKLRGIHDTFHVSNLKRCFVNEDVVIPLDEVQLDDKLHFVEEPVEIMDKEVKQLKQSGISIVKVRWNSRRGLGFTWELEDFFRSKYPHLFARRRVTRQGKHREVIKDDGWFGVHKDGKMGMETKMPNFRPCSPQHKCINDPKKGNPQHALQNKGVIDSGWSRHMTGNMSYLSDFDELNVGYVAFGGNPKGGKISGNEKAREEIVQQYVLFPVWSSGSTNPQTTDEDAAFDEKEHEFDEKKPESEVNVSPSSCAQNLSAEFKDFSDNNINEDNAAEDITYSDDEDDVGVEADFNNLETSITVSHIPTTRVHKDHPVTQIIGDQSLATQTRSMTRLAKDQGGASLIQDEQGLGLSRFAEEEIDYKEVFAPVAKIEAIRLFLAYASFIGFMVYQMDVKSAFLYGTIEEETYVCQPLGFKDPDYPNKDKYVAEILRKFRLTDGKSASTPIDIEKPLLKDPDGKDVDVHTYRSMIGSLMYLTLSRPDIMFAVCACARFQVTPKASHLHAVKRIFRYLKGKSHLGLWYPKDSPFDLVAYSDSDYAGTSLYRKSTTGGCQFLGCRLIFWQCKKQTVKATSSTEAEYVVLSAGSLTSQQMVLNSPCLTHTKNWLVQIKRSLSWLVQKQMTLGVNTPRCDEDRLELMELTVFLLPEVEKVGVEVSVVDLQVSSVRLILLLLGNFKELARIGYEKPSTKLTFYKAFFSSQWKFLIYTILQCMSAKRTSWNEFSSSMASAVICVSSGRKFNFSRKQVGDLSTYTTKYTSPTLTQKVFANMRRVGKGFSGVKTPLFEGIIVEQQVAKGGIIENIDVDEDVVLEDAKDVAVEKSANVEDNANIQGRTIESQAEIYKIHLDHANKVLSMQEEESELIELQEVVDVVTTAKIITKVVTAASTTITTADVPIPTATTAAAPTLTTAAPTLTATPSRRTNGVVIRDPEESTPTSTIIHSEAKSKDKGKRVLVDEPKPLKKKAQIKQDVKYARELEAGLKRTID